MKGEGRMEKKLFYLVDSETKKVVPVEAVKEEGQGQWKCHCAKCKVSSRTVTINENLGIFHCYGCEWKGDLNHLDRPKQPTDNTSEKKAPLFNPGNKNQSSSVIESTKAEEKNGKSFLSLYLKNRFFPIHCNGYHPEKNQEKDPEKAYKMAKKPTYAGWNKPGYVAPALEEIEVWEKAGGWIGWRIPEGAIYLDVEDQEDTDNVKTICHLKNIMPGIHQTNKGLHFGFSTDQQYPADSTVFTKSGIKLTYRVGGKNYLILAPTNERRWEAWKDIKELPALPDQLKPYDRKNIEDVLNCLSHSVRSAYREGYFSGYEDLDAAYMALLVDCKSSEDVIHNSFKIVFREKYDEKQTSVMCERTRTRIKNGDPVIGTGTFIQRVKEQELDEVQRFAWELQAFKGTGRAVVSDEWPDPIPFDKYSSLPDFSLDTLSGIGREVVESVSKVNQVDPALTACLYLAVLSASSAKKAVVDLGSHKEPLNLYLCPISDSGNRKSKTDSDMTKPLYEFQKARQEEIKPTIQVAQNAFKIKEKRVERLQRKAAEEDDPVQRREFEEEAAKLTRELAETPVPNSPIYLVDDVTPEKLGSLMADNGERMAAITPEGGLFEIMAGRYSKDGIGNIDLFLKAHAGDYLEQSQDREGSKYHAGASIDPLPCRTV